MERYMERLKERDKRIRVKTIGRATVYWASDEALDDYVEFIKEMVGEPKPKDEIYLRLLDLKAFSPKAAVPVNIIGDKELLDELIISGRIVLTSGGKVYLTELGRKIAEGAALIYEK